MRVLKYNDPLPATDAEALECLPDYPEAQNLYHVYREMGLSVLAAWQKVLEAIAGIEVQS